MFVAFHRCDITDLWWEGTFKQMNSDSSHLPHYLGQPLYSSDFSHLLDLNDVAM